MKRISLFLLLFLLLKATVMYSQDGHPETNFRIVPVSPNAASLGTYGLIPTDNYVGQARISIPIYEIDLDGKKFPIALSYHTDGTRVAQEATWIGLGWTLQAGGCVVRQVQGTDDFAARGCYNLTDAPWLTNPRFEVTDQNLEKYMGYFKGDYDAEPDMFYFNAGGHSGSMYFDVLKNNRQLNAVPTIQTQEKVVKMVYNTSNKTWTMTDLEGYVYSFSTKEITYYFLNTIDFFQTDITRSHIFPYYNEPQIVTAWMLDSVTSPNGGKITFSYKKESIFTPISTTEDVISLSKIVNGQLSSQSPQYFTNKFNYNYSYSKIEQWTLSAITFEGGKVEFGTTDREDIESAETGKKVQKLSSIKVSDTAGNLIKTKNDYSMQVVEQAQIADTTTSKHVEKSNEEERTTELTTITKTEYDTEKPVNPDTGKPPVKSEEITQKTKEITKKAENTSETNINKGMSGEINRKENIVLQNEIEKQREESTLFKQIGWCAISVSVLFIIVWLLKRKPH